MLTCANLRLLTRNNSHFLHLTKVNIVILHLKIGDGFSKNLSRSFPHMYVYAGCK